MVKSIVIILLLQLIAGLSLISAMQLKIPAMHQVEPREFLEMRKLQSLSLEFTQQFENITLKDLEIPSERIPSLQDLQCLADVGLWMNGISSASMWSIKMIDAWGSKPAGILSLNIIDLGNYEQCININQLIATNHAIKGKYCMAEIPFGKMLGIESNVIRSVSLKIGVCFPSSCSSSNMDTLLNRAIQSLLNVTHSGALINSDTCQTADREAFPGLTIFTIVLLSVFGALALLATLYDYFICQDQSQLPVLIKIFSIRASSRALFRTTNPKSNPNVIDCLHGMRCMSLLWVVFGHEYMFGLVQPNINQWSIYHWLQQPFQNMIVHAAFSVDTFFFLSGLLVIMIALRSMDKTKGKLSVPLMYLHRYLRLAPLVGVAILVYMQLLPLLVSGPLSNNGVDDFEKCERTWFWSLLFVQNYATTEICLGHTWYLGVDMQLYLLSPIFLFALYKWGKKAAIGIVILMILLLVWMFTLMMVKEYSVYFRNGFGPADSNRWLYHSTHLHATPWLVGAVFGYFLHVNRGKSFKLTPLMVWAGWLLSLAIIFACEFSLVGYDKFGGPKLTMLGDALYYTLTRLGWPLALCWVVFACMQGYGGMANSFLSCPLWQPLSKLSYSVYIWHILIQEMNVRRIQSSTYFSDYEMVSSFFFILQFSGVLNTSSFLVDAQVLVGLWFYRSRFLCNLCHN
ncbi:nose resistant to fluoxetine protein 6-like isoform X2 [Drosophila sulfurigaster albostrigata]|uniref:nose resistant to fluoxetine protein 6-like isoform X2 n=1 Tax=Drosophila sulfurigaster albostrigata TaxID=89887 RepID=UPI002D21BA67|nr:nose resistant to fluoxetine protein 6-like isoform X2 [Drosophila sulfurigaster albostrigata]